MERSVRLNCGNTDDTSRQHTHIPANSTSSMAIPITIITGFLGSGKTTLILNLIPQLPKDYKLALLKNEFGDLAIDSELATSAAISGVQELLNGCICCNLVGQLGDALETLRRDVQPDRIIIETSGSALPTTLVLEINRLIRESGWYVLDGVISVVDVQNWEGYEDTSYTARLQARYTDLIVFNKWELVDERRFDVCLDRVGDLDVQTPTVRSDRGRVPMDILLGIDGPLARALDGKVGDSDDEYGHGHHSSEVEVLSCSLISSDGTRGSVEVGSLMNFLEQAPREEVYRIKAKISADSRPRSSDDIPDLEPVHDTTMYILNWAFGRWTFTVAKEPGENDCSALRMTIITARYESDKWKKRLENGRYLELVNEKSGTLKIEKIL